MSGRLAKARRIVVKIGSALLVGDGDGRIRRAWLESLADDVAAARARGQEIVIVTSGAIALGRRRLGYAPGALRLDESQAAAACGQIHLAHAYEEALGRHDIRVAQILMTLDDTEARRRYLNALGTINRLLKLGAIPVVNENDTVATTEIRFGDNDRLAARVAAMISADVLVLLSDIDGFYSADPKRHPDARLIPEINEITDEIAAMAGKAPAGDSSGGMETKLAAARIAVAAGSHMVIANGRLDHPLHNILDGAPASWFIAAASPRAARKSWIAGSLNPAGTLVVDDGARNALATGKSLLPAGITKVEGRFEKGDAVLVKDAAGHEIARGLVAYSCQDARRIAGHKSGEIGGLLGYRGREEMIHRDDLVLS
jgi:glutamate 5-kinase